MSHDIAEYTVDYFVPVAREMLDAPLGEHGFAYAGDFRGVSLYWAAGPAFFNVAYLPETLPNYELLFGVGRDESPPVGPALADNSVGVWRLLPPDRASRIAADWHFDSPEELREALRRAWDAAVLPYAMPTLRDDDELRRVIAAYDDEVTREDERMMNERLLEYARDEFAAGRFLQALQAYAEFPDEQLSNADRKRVELARRRA